MLLETLLRRHHAKLQPKHNPADFHPLSFEVEGEHVVGRPWKKAKRTNKGYRVVGRLVSRR